MILPALTEATSPRAALGRRDSRPSTALMLPVLESILSEFGRRASGGGADSYVRRASPWSEPALARESRVPAYGRAIVV
jgi:hypothetical protein